MKKLNKLVALLLMVVMVLSVAGCGSKKDDTAGSMDLSKGTESNTDTTKDDDTKKDDDAEAFNLEEGINAYYANMPDHIYKINQKEFIDKVKANDDMVVVDIRTEEDYKKGHVKGAYNAPWGPAIAENITKISQDKEVFIYCYSGQTAGQAVMTLNLAGINARSVNLGFNFGISKVEGYEDVIEETVNEFGSETYDVPKEVQTALTDYYNGLADVKDTKFKNYKVSEDNLKAMIDNKEDFYLLSIRGEKDFNEGHIAGASNIPWGAGMEKQFATLPKDKPVVVYCYTGQTAGQTVAGLRLLGIDAVSLNGGLGMDANAPLGWSNKGYEVVADGVVEAGVNSYFANMPEHIYKINQKEFIEKVKADEDMVIVDIRTAEDYKKGHVKGAYNAPWGPAIAENITKISQDKDVYIYCYSGQTAGQAVMTLNLAGINARSVNLGFNFGISKVEGYEDVIEETVNEFGSETYDVPEEVKAALTAYYNGLADVKETKFKNYKVSEENLKAMIDDKEDFYLLSIRSAKDFEEGHISGANNIPWGAGMEKQFGTLPKDKPVVVYCYTGQTAGQTVAALRLLGYDAVSLNGGMGMEINAPLGWINNEFEVVK
ncbi:rhodanese-like domain-containing protein [Vallitalea guaymasensis]|uniref:rhodanese-like domain-containing protein n=1 Tax=Vallitalea guaymasensis TaxID=1185412 RepID=UPI0023546B56|nr:rhodanese-like domain-containing protein [Vallitalea guaymasensis]